MGSTLLECCMTVTNRLLHDLYSYNLPTLYWHESSMKGYLFFWLQRRSTAPCTYGVYAAVYAGISR
jgi:hypothetical protein